MINSIWPYKQVVFIVGEKINTIKKLTIMKGKYDLIKNKNIITR